MNAKKFGDVIGFRISAAPDRDVTYLLADDPEAKTKALRHAEDLVARSPGRAVLVREVLGTVAQFLGRLYRGTLTAPGDTIFDHPGG